jgi:hypothetical protein
MFYVWAFCHTTDINKIVHYANDNFQHYQTVSVVDYRIDICRVTKGSHLEHL